VPAGLSILVVLCSAFVGASFVPLDARATTGAAAADTDRLFPQDVPEREWVEFEGAGFSEPVAGMVFRTGEAPCCGVPLGGIGTGCLDVDTQGAFGYSAIFENVPRNAKLFAPFLGLAVGERTWVLASREIIEGGELDVRCLERGLDPAMYGAIIRELKGVEPAREVHYWGHYPIADMEFETDAPVSVGVRAWSPFIPGDAEASNIPGAVFEVRLRNETDAHQQGTLAFTFPGPTWSESGRNTHGRQYWEAGELTALTLNGAKVNYTVGVIGGQNVRFGRDLNTSSTAWSRMRHGLDHPDAQDAGTAVAVDFSLDAGVAQTVRFVLTWFAPTWGINWRYTRMYASRYGSSADVARDLATRHEGLLRRVLAWQQVVYTDETLPIWLRETLVNCLGLIAEDSYWAQSIPPLEWAGENGLFGMIECPKIAAQIECIPCSWYGNLPIVYFFPELAHSTLKGYKRYQAEDGAAPFIFGHMEEMFAHGQEWQNQVALNGFCYVDMVDRLWQRTGDDGLLHEFYDSVKRSTTLTATMGEPPASVISMPPGDGQTEWWEGWPWTGMTAHAGGLHLSNMVIAERMAERMGDDAFATQCRDWLAQGQENMEQAMWADRSYLLMHNVNSGVREDKIMANQLDAEWVCRFHGLPGVFRPDRVDIVLQTVKDTCLVETGAVGFASPEGTPELTTYGIFVPEILILAMTYMYEGDRETGLDVAHRLMSTLVRRQGFGWDLPNQIYADTGERQMGTDYYQALILWAMPSALEGKDLAAPCEAGGLVDRILRAVEGVL